MLDHESLLQYKTETQTCTNWLYNCTYWSISNSLPTTICL